MTPGDAAASGSRVARGLERGRAAVGRAWRAGVPAMAIATLAVQGLTYVVQLALAPMLGPAAFGVVRAAEATVATVILVAAAGMPTVMMRLAAEADRDGWRPAVFDNVVLTVCGTGALAGIGLAVLSPWAAAAAATPYLRVLAVSVFATAVARTGIGYFYAVGEVRLVPRVTVPLAVLSGSLTVAAAGYFGLPGWAAARAVGDTLLAASVVVVCLRLTGRRFVRWHDEPRLRSRALVGMGVPLAASLIARTTLDNAPILVVGKLAQAGAELGIVGLYMLVGSGLLVVPAAMVTLALPRMVNRRSEPDTLRRLHVRLLLAGLALTLPAAILGALLGPGVVRALLPAFGGAPDVASWLLLLVVPRLMTSIAGTLLLALDRIRTTLLIASTSLLVVGAIEAFGMAQWGLAGLVLGALVGESLVAAVSVTIAHAGIGRVPTDTATLEAAAGEW